jgi:enoyl-CoA hydratase
MPDSGIDPWAPVAGLDVKLADGVLSVTIDRPESLNSLNVPVLTGVADAIERAATDPEVKLVRLGGNGRGFSSGGAINVDEFWGKGEGTDVVVQGHRIVRAITALPRPVVAAVQGPAVGLGVSLALACDVVLASDSAFFILANTNVGLMPDGGASALIAAAVGRIRAMRMALLPERVSAVEALSWGLVSAVYPAANFRTEVDKVIARLLAGPPVAFANTKKAINAATLGELEAAFARESDGQTVLIQSNDFIEGATAFQQRRPAIFTGS